LLRQYLTPDELQGWETNRRSQSQPFLDANIATAYEPYLLDIYEDPRLVVKHLRANAKEILDSASEDIGSDLTHVLNVLEGREFSIPALQYAEQMFLTLREITLADGLETQTTVHRGEKYKSRILELVQQKGDFQVVVSDSGVSQRIVIPEQKDIVHLTKPRLSKSDLDVLLASQQDKFIWNYIDIAGKVGNPICRKLLQEVEQNQVDEDLTHHERRYKLFVARMNARNAGIPSSELPKVPLVHG
jgi:hypothetical protein